ncbi:hypothetical protein GCM10010191_16150 [Actinomadura vinacea]|uniref:Uncharacterized protein n=1 Tax=Actinomadura vinacea TaxID=115336 RepID=A0ABN3INR0_9ACTN
MFDGIDLSPSGNLLLAGNREARTVWDLRTLPRRPGGRTLHSAADGRNVLTHELAPALTAAALCQTTCGGLSRQEWKATLPTLDYRATCLKAP